MKRKTVLCDVDGVVADLMGGFSRWFHVATFGKFPNFDPRTVPLFDIRRAARTPEHVDLDDALRKDVWWPYRDGDGGINGAFMEYMSLDSTYDNVPLIEGALQGIARLSEGFDVLFVTAVMDAAPTHIPSKFRWLKRHFPSIPIFTSPSKLKMQIKGEFGIDDRYDTCVRWTEAGTRSFLFKQTWNEAPDGYQSYDWTNLVEAIENAE